MIGGIRQGAAAFDRDMLNGRGVGAGIVIGRIVIRIELYGKAFRIPLYPMLPPPPPSAVMLEFWITKAMPSAGGVEGATRTGT